MRGEYSPRLKIVPWENSHVDDVMRHLQGPNYEAQFKRFRALSVRVGVAGSYESTADYNSVTSCRI
jgi:hypothetical protein